MPTIDNVTERLGLDMCDFAFVNDGELIIFFGIAECIEVAKHLVEHQPEDVGGENALSGLHIRTDEVRGFCPVTVVVGKRHSA